jgi:Family of unknown function (DUF6156)
MPVTTIRNFMETQNTYFRYFVSYSGIKLPLKLVNELLDNDRDNRNTFFRATYDNLGRMIRCEKLVYGESELSHEYEYYENGALKRAEIVDADGELTVLTYDLDGSSS